MVSRWPVWTPDGDRLTFASLEAGTWDIYDLVLDGTQEPRALLAGDELQIPMSWSPDGRSLFCVSNPSPQRVELWVLTDDATPELVDEASDQAEFSPAGGWIAYGSDETGQDEIYIRTWLELGPPLRVSPDGGTAPRWTEDGRVLFYLQETGVYPVTFDPDDRSLGPPERVRVRGDQGRGYDVTSDGRRVVALVSEEDEGVAQLRVVIDWYVELNERVPLP